LRSRLPCDVLSWFLVCPEALKCNKWHFKLEYDFSILLSEVLRMLISRFWFALISNSGYSRKLRQHPILHILIDFWALILAIWFVQFE
jgi:hypothetical protein